jgi:hypothetical protein
MRVHFGRISVFLTNFRTNKTISDKFRYFGHLFRQVKQFPTYFGISDTFSDKNFTQ